MLELGILGKIDDIADEAMRFYALIGLCVSTTGEIDRHMYRCYVNAGALPEKDAAEKYYRYVKFSYRRDLTDKAVRAFLKSPATRSRWDERISEVQSVCGPNGARNLIGHNPLVRQMRFRATTEQNLDVRFEFLVSQSSGAVLSGMRRPETHTLRSLKNYAYDLLGAETRLADFQQRHLPARP